MGTNIRNMLDKSDYYSVVETRPKNDRGVKTLRQTDGRRQRNVTVPAVKHDHKSIIPAPAHFELRTNDILITLNEHLRKGDSPT